MKKNEYKTSPSEKNKSLGVAKTVFFNSCVFYTLFSMLILATQLFSSRDMIAPGRFFMLFPFALSVSLANLIFKASTINKKVKLLIHCFLTTFSFYLFMCLPMKNTKTGILIVIFIALYVIIVAIASVIKRLTQKDKKNEKEYTSMFGSKK